MTEQRIGVTILGSTGSVGTNTLDVLKCHNDKFKVVALSAHDNDEALFQQCVFYKPTLAAMSNPAAASRLYRKLRNVGMCIDVFSGLKGLETIAIAPETNYVVAATVGISGLFPALAAAKANKRILLANKEILVTAGSLFMSIVREYRTELIPIDSEHNAIMQCISLNANFNTEIRRIILTASGGPCRLIPTNLLQYVTPEQACNHPTWNMGKKVSIDSATMMNKGLEIIEAHWLFGVQLSKINVLIHPQSVLHSLVEYEDGAMLAQLSNPDMRIPIAHALGWPKRIESGTTPLELHLGVPLEFQLPDLEKFPCISLACAALEAGGTAPTILNAANEIAVQAFLKRKILFTDIATVIKYTLDKLTCRSCDQLTKIIEDDMQARLIARQWIVKHIR